MNHKHRAVLHSLFAHPISSNIDPKLVRSVLEEIGAEISNTNSSEAYQLLPGYFADASLHLDLTERAGFYAGAVFQSAGNYTHRLESETANYASKVDLSNQSGLRAGLSIRF